MKTKLILFTMIALLIGGVGCERKVEVYPDAIIVKELPKLNVIGRHTKSVVIQTQKELENVFTDDELMRYEELQKIDFSKHTLLLGYGSYGNEVSNMAHSFYKTENGNYTYLLKISGLATRPDAFRYGILVVKLPKSAEVVFKLDELKLTD